MPKIKFSKRTFAATGRESFRNEILQAIEINPEIRAEIRRVFQVANRRIQNIESKGLNSPAVMGLGKGNIKGFTKFSMRGDFEDLKIEYAKAVAFLRQPTSTATGTREYNRHIAQRYNLTDREFNAIADKLNNKISSVREEKWVEQYLMRYKDYTGELEQTAQSAASQIESDAIMIENRIDNNIERIVDNINGDIERILGNFSDFGIE